MSTTTCPVFRPTSEEFSNFKTYILHIEKVLSSDDIGICKIIPPLEWLVEKGDYQMSSMPVIVEYPIKQVVSGRAGVFSVDLLELKAMSINDFAEYDKKNSNNRGDSIQERERKFWRSLGNPGAWDHPIYGADQIGTLFKGDQGGSWNVNKLDSIVNLLGPVSGVSTAYLYVGTWRSMFAYHVEDLDLYSINYLHAGASKSWYSIKQKDKKRFESLAESYYVEEHQQCHEFLRHKTKMFSPIKLKEHGIEFTTLVHEPGEFVITFPGAYHAGFNHGLNIAESTNFATPRWFDIGSRAKRCICRPHSVAINVCLLETLYLRKELSENKSVSTFHSRDDIVTLSRRYRCICGMNDIFEVDADTPPSLCCQGCSLWGHTRCYEPQLETLDTSLKTSPLCFMCSAIEFQHTCPSSELSFDEESHLTEKLPIPSLKKTKKKRSLEEAIGPQMSIGDLVSVLLPSHGVATVGTITDIEDDLGRLHVKGTRKDLDIWTSLSECVIVEQASKNKNKSPKKEVTSNSIPEAQKLDANCQSQSDSVIKSEIGNIKNSPNSCKKLLQKPRLKSPIKKQLSNQTDSDPQKKSVSKIEPSFIQAKEVSDSLVKESFHNVSKISEAVVPDSIDLPHSTSLPLTLPDDIFSRHRDKLLLALANINENDLTLWLKLAIFPLFCAASSTNSLTLESDLKNNSEVSSCKENIKFLQAILPYARSGKFNMLRSLALRYLTIVSEVHSELRSHILSTLGQLRSKSQAIIP